MFDASNRDCAMRLLVFSDLHCEMQRVRFPDRAPEGADVIVIAGDLDAADEVEHALEFLFERYRMPIVFVPGNHEFYVSPERSGLDRGLVTDRARMGDAILRMRAAGTPVHFLDDSEVVIDGVRFLGSTLWTDFAFDRDAEEEGFSPEQIASRNMRIARAVMADYHAIRDLTATDVLAMHEASHTFLCRSLAQDFAGPTVCVSHHVPHPLGEPEIYRDAIGNAYFTNSAAAFGDILESGHGPDLWIYGHTHHAVDVEVGRTRLLCNPYGYAGRADEQDNGFLWELTADV
jgi:predicted phosphodiesterase